MVFFMDISPQPSEIEANLLPAPVSDSNIVSTGGGSVLKNGTFKSPNFASGASGWQINSDGNVEFNNGTFRGTLQANEINIPDTTSTNSFHVDSDGNTWWGATTFASAPAKVSNAGAATFTSATISGYVLGSKGAFGGDGSDGALSITSGTTTLDINSAQTLIKNYTSLSVSNGATLSFSNPNTNGSIIQLKSQGNITNAGTITAASMGAVHQADGYGSIKDTNKGNDGQGGGGGSKAGGAAAAVSRINTVVLVRLLSITPGAGGGDGGDGNVGSTKGAGARGGGAILFECAGAWNFTGTISVAGSNGSNGNNGGGTSSGGGGGGGGAGGMIIALYNTLTSDAGTYTKSGGNGGNGASATSNGAATGGGGGSGGGHVNASGAGGDGGAVSTNGSNGSAGSGTGGGSAGTGGTRSGSDGGGGGGGGGAAGMSISAVNNFFA